MKITKRQLVRIIREEHGAHWGMGSHEDSRTHPGEEDYTGHMGDESKTHAGEDYEGSDVEHKAHTAMAAIHDLASAAGVELDTTATSPEDAASEDMGIVTMESRRRRRLKSRLRRVVREERYRLREDSISDELEHLRKNKEDDLKHIDALEKDIEDDREEMKHAEEARKDEALRRRLRRIVRENTRPTRARTNRRRRR